jgi:hypothetical protein
MSSSSIQLPANRQHQPVQKQQQQQKKEATARKKKTPDERCSRYINPIC